MSYECFPLVLIAGLGLEKCNQPMVVGTCTTWISKWYYDSKKEQCEVFQYTGCGGNDNKFDSKAECEYHCRPGDRECPELF